MVRCLAYIMKGSFSLHLWAIHYSRGPPKKISVCITPKSSNHSLYYIIYFFPLTLYFLKYEMTEFDRLDSILCGFFLCVCLFWLWHIWSRIVPNRKKYTHTKDKFPTSDFILLFVVISFSRWNRHHTIHFYLMCTLFFRTY